MTTQSRLKKLGELREAGCTCQIAYITTDAGQGGIKGRIVYCPMHYQAPALTASVEALGPALEDCLDELASEASAAAVAEGRIPHMPVSAVAGHEALATIPDLEEE